MKRARQHKKEVLATGVVQLELPLFGDTGVAQATLDTIDSPTSGAVQDTHLPIHESEVSEVAEFEEAVSDRLTSRRKQIILLIL